MKLVEWGRKEGTIADARGWAKALRQMTETGKALRWSEDMAPRTGLLNTVKPRMGDDELERIAGALKADNSYLRIATAEFLGEWGSAPKALHYRIFEERNPRVRESLITAMGTMGGIEVTQRLTRIIGNETEGYSTDTRVLGIDEMYRVITGQQFGQYEGPTPMGYLAGLADIPEVRRLRGTLENTIGELWGPEAANTPAHQVLRLLPA